MRIRTFIQSDQQMQKKNTQNVRRQNIHKK